MSEPRRRVAAGPCALSLLAVFVLLLPRAAPVAQESADWLLPPLTAEAAGLRTGDPAPALRWTTADGATASLEALEGEVVVVVFWASWCTWCRRLWPVLRDIAASHPARPRIVPVNVLDENPAAAAHAARSEFTWPLLTAYEGEAERWFVTATPHVVVIDAGGYVAAVVSGFDPEGAAIRAALDRSLEKGASP